MTSLHRTLSCLVVCVVVVDFAGCAQQAADLPDVAPVSGTVTMDGSPLADVLVTFEPTTGQFSQGKTDASGKYELSYINNVKGAVLGAHKVSITTPSEAEGPGDVKDDPIPAKYNAETTLTAEVKAGENTCDFALESK